MQPATDLSWWVILIAGASILAFALRTGTVGIRGGSVDKKSNPVAYWIAATLLSLLCILSVAGIAFGW